MMMKPEQIFRGVETPDEFREKLIAMDGAFDLGADDMIALGNAYFEKYPDSFSDRNMGNVHIGYQVARACILEKMLVGVDAGHKQMLRSLFDNITLFDETLERLRAVAGASRLGRYYDLVSGNLDDVRKSVDAIPKGMVKERFVGGITKFYNVMYLFKSGVERSGAAPG